MKFKIHLLLLFIGIGYLAFASSCSSKNDIRLISIESIDVIEIIDKTMEVIVTAKVENNRRVNAKVRAIDAEVSLAGSRVGSIDYKGKDMIIPKRKQSKIRLPANLDLIELEKIYPQLMEKGPVALEVKGKFVLDVGLFNIGIKKELKNDFNFREEMASLVQQNTGKDGIQIKSIKPKKIGISKSTLEIEVLLKNTMSLPYTLSDIHLKFRLNDAKQHFGTWDKVEEIQLAANSEHTILVEMEVDNVRGFGQGITSLFSKKIIKTEGDAKVTIVDHSFQIPVEQEIPLDSISPFD